MYPLLNSAAKVVQNFDMAKKKSVINYFEHEKFTRYHWREAPVPALTVDSRGVPDPTPCHIERSRDISAACRLRQKAHL